jgi:molybdate transport system ATP-binding protein
VITAQNDIRLVLPRAGFDLDVEFSLPAGGITALFGVSGAGKTSILRCVAGLERAATGRVLINGEVWQDQQRGIFLPTWRRPLGYVFQEPSLFAHLDVRANLEYGLRRTKASGTDRGDLDSAIELLGIGDLLQRRVHQLSGGERQRVAIVRALATAPQLLLLDEPLAALDYARRQEILPWLEKLRDELNTPMLYVTHSADEVARLANQLVVLERGRVVAAGSVVEVLSAIDVPVVMGEDAGALLEARIAARDTQWHLARAEFDSGSLWLRDNGLAVGREVRLRVLARDVSITSERPHHTSIQNLLPCTIESIAADTHPSQALVRVSCGQSLLLARLTRRAVATLDLHPGKPAWAQVKSVALVE